MPVSSITMPWCIERAKIIFEARMNPYCFIFEVEPQFGNPIGAHVSRAITHIWVLSDDIKDARDVALRFLKSDRWDVKQEKEAFLPTSEQIDGLSAAEASSYRTAASDGIHATFNYWHK